MAGRGGDRPRARPRRPGRGAQDMDAFRHVAGVLRAQTDVILCLTTSGIPGRNLPTAERIAPLALRPRWRASTPAPSAWTPGCSSTSPSSSTRSPRGAGAGRQTRARVFRPRHGPDRAALPRRGQDPGAAALPVRHRHALRDAGDRRCAGRRRGPVARGLHLVGDRRRAHPDAHGDARAGHGRSRARRARGQHPLPPGRARDRQRAARQAGGAAGHRDGTSRGDARPGA